MSTSNIIDGVKVASHFKGIGHQYSTAKQGVWVFMVTEILMFGGLFVGYILMHSQYPEMFAEGAKYLDWRLGFINTLVLVFSSLTMALGIYYNQVNQSKKATIALALTLLCGLIFMGIKYYEYMHKFHLGLYPGRYLNLEMVKPEHSNLGLYFGLYFCMSGLHGIHVLIGMSLITWLLYRNMKGEFNSKYYTPVEGVGIFWHIIDLIWIFLFPLLYLVG